MYNIFKFASNSTGNMKKSTRAENVPKFLSKISNLQI